MHYSQLEPVSVRHAIYIVGYKTHFTTFNGETYQQFPYDMLGITITTFTGKVNIPLFSENGCTVPILQKVLQSAQNVT